MASDAKPPSPVTEDPPTDDAMDAEVTEEKDVVEAEAEDGEQQEGEAGEEKGDAEDEEQQEGEAGEEKDDADDEEQQEGEEGEGEPQVKSKRGGRRKRLPGEVRATPTPVERPSRERKTVERYSELSPRVTPSKKSPAILQGSGTKLKDIPNVSFKLSKRKVDENLQSLHTLLFGRKSGVHFLKRNISQFSGFVWTDNEDKQRTKIKEKLDKFNKEKLLDFCEILDVRSKTNEKKEEVLAKLLEFLESPCVTRDVVLADKPIRKKRGRKSKGSALRSTEGASEKKRRKVLKETVEAQTENDGEDDDSAGSEDVSMGEDEDLEVKEHDESDEKLDETPAKKKSTDDKKGTQEAGSKIKQNIASKKQSSTKSAKALSKLGQHTDDEPDVELESEKAGKKSSKKSSKEINAPVDKASKKVSKSKKEEGKGQSNNSVASTRKKQGAKASNGNKGKGKGSSDDMPAPTSEELHDVVSNILKEVDFNTATLADILRQLGSHFKMDLMDRKSEVKGIIEEVINSMSDDEGEEVNNEDDAEDNGKEDNSKEDSDEGDDK